MLTDYPGCFRRVALGAAIVLLSFFASTCPAIATNFYADNSCTADGNGTTSTCGVNGPRNTGAGLQALIDGAACGDTIFIKQGSGPYTNALHGSPSEFANEAYFLVKRKSCSSTAPLTIRGSDPANRPTLCLNAACTDNDSSPDRATITVTASAYVKIQYMKVFGAVFIEGAATNQPGMEVSYLDISGGKRCDGNFSVLYTDDSRVWIHHNLLHNLNALNCNQKAGMRMFGSYGSVIEYNTIVEGTGVPMDRGGMDLKDCTANVIVRYNVVKGGGRTNSQDQDCQPGSPLTTPATDNHFYGNIYVTSSAQQMTGDMDSPLEFYNNTIVAGAMDWYGDPTWGPIRGSTVHDNLVVTGGGSQSGTNVNVGIRPESWPYHSAYSWDYNIYHNGSRYYGNGTTYPDLASWRTASGLDAHSQELGCTFVQTTDPTAANFYKITPGSSCLTGPSRIGRIEAGAYGVTNCVGHTCGLSGGDATRPAGPINLRVQ